MPARLCFYLQMNFWEQRPNDLQENEVCSYVYAVTMMGEVVVSWKKLFVILRNGVTKEIWTFSGILKDSLLRSEWQVFIFASLAGDSWIALRGLVIFRGRTKFHPHSII